MHEKKLTPSQVDEIIDIVRDAQDDSIYMPRQHVEDIVLTVLDAVETVQEDPDIIEWTPECNRLPADMFYELPSDHAVTVTLPAHAAIVVADDVLHATWNVAKPEWATPDLPLAVVVTGIYGEIWILCADNLYRRYIGEGQAARTANELEEAAQRIDATVHVFIDSSGSHVKMDT